MTQKGTEWPSSPVKIGTIPGLQGPQSFWGHWGTKIWQEGGERSPQVACVHWRSPRGHGTWPNQDHLFEAAEVPSRRKTERIMVGGVGLEVALFVLQVGAIRQKVSLMV